MATTELAPPPAARPAPTPGGSRELLTLAAPLILSQGFMTVQVFVDAVLLSWYDARAMAASLPAVMWYWLAFGFLQVTAGYTATFVAQYTGAGRPQRVGPAVWQGIFFAVFAGLFLLLLVPAAPLLIAAAGHDPALQGPEIAYLRSLAFAAMPMLIMAAVNGFFAGRGQTWTVLGIEAVGTAVNVLLALVLIFGQLGFPEWGIEGAGWATVAGSWVSALLALGLFLGRRYRDAFATASGCVPERELFVRLLRYGGPAGIQVFLDVFVFNLFIQMVGRLGESAIGAATLTIRLNMIAFLPMMGLGQAVCILVGQRLGGDRPDLAQKSTYTGLKWALGYQCAVAAVYLALPTQLVSIFEGGRDAQHFAEVAALVPRLLVCVAVYSVVNAVCLTFAFALRGAGDTLFVTLATFCLAWPIMVVPTALAVWAGASVELVWWFVTAHICAMSATFYLRYRTGKWKSMRVIEAGLGEGEPEGHRERVSHLLRDEPAGASRGRRTFALPYRSRT
jgi:MATE family multidrug resistance protein